MAVQLVLALLALFSLSAASEPDCEELVKPLSLEDRSPIYGKWIFLAGTSDNEDFLKHLKTVNNSWIELSPSSDSNVVNLRWGDKIDGKCIHGETNSTFSGNTTKVTFNFNMSTSDHVGKYLQTCRDCILWTDNSEMVTNGEAKKGRNLYFFTKTGKVEESQMEDFKKQAACLKFLSEFHFGEITELCPDEKEAASPANED
ncbi:uncharacterized protein LOC115365373 [Myripristis murdjan]|uniref:Uncharacterized LOC115365373 n=1 Tax=Myripristis murdjan TaxID=586833 RepID=A0A667ZNR4_9TELE|nr:uncharacterized protein LOC115365373 [Myripristis murdjan]